MSRADDRRRDQPEGVAMRDRSHLHPCGQCGVLVPCAGELVENYDGWPEVMCRAYHQEGADRSTFRCEACEERTDPCDNEVSA